MSERREQDGERDPEERPSSPLHPSNANESSTRPAEPPLSQLPIAKILAQMEHCAVPVSAGDTTCQQAATLGRALRRWRIQRGLTRQVVAARLRLEPDQMLCLEHNLLQPAAMPRVPLANLVHDLGPGDVDQALAAAIAGYLALPPPTNTPSPPHLLNKR